MSPCLMGDLAVGRAQRYDPSTSKRQTPELQNAVNKKSMVQSQPFGT